MSCEDYSDVMPGHVGLAATGPIVRYNLVHPEAVVPKYYWGSAGADLYAVVNFVVPGRSTVVVSTGIVLEIPDGFEGQVRSRSSLAMSGIVVANSPGTIDADYRGEIMVILRNLTEIDAEFAINDRIAQLVIAPVVRASFECSDKPLSSTRRGTGGFGSSGR